MSGRQQPEQLVLRAISVLIFVHQNIAVPLAIVFLQFRHFFQNRHGFQKEVVEIERVRTLQALVVFLVEALHNLCRVRGIRCGIARRRNAMVFGIADPADDLARRQIRFPDFFERLLKEALLVVGVVNGKIPLVAQVMDFPSKQADAKRMERGDEWFGLSNWTPTIF